MKKLFANNDPKKYALIDNDIYETIQEMGLKFGVNNKGYFYSTSHMIKLPGMTEKKRLLLHHFVYILKTGEEPELTVDHIDRNPLNDKFCNLRLATSQQQKYNHRKQKNNSSGFIGVCHLHKNKNKKNGGNHYWLARIQRRGGKDKVKQFPYTDEGLLAAARWYDQKAIEYHGEFAVLNFPDNDNKIA